MNDLQLVKQLANLLTLAFPIEETATIQTVSGTSVQFTSNLSATANQWRWGILEITSGTCKNLRSLIISNNADVVIVASMFANNLRPQAGDTVRIYGGPLADAIIYEFDPESTIDAAALGKTFIVTVSAVDGVFMVKGLSGRSTLGIETRHQDVRFSVTVEAPNWASDPGVLGSEDDVKKSIYDLPTLKEQVAMICFHFRMQEGNRMFGVDNIEYTQVGIQRRGQQDFNRAYVIEFVCRLT